MFLFVFVLDQPTVQHKPLQIVNESETVILTREISSNPSSNASWYDKIHLLKTEPSVMTTTLEIKNATCTDTKNFTLVVQNKVGNDTDLVELIVNCKLCCLQYSKILYFCKTLLRRVEFI